MAAPPLERALPRFRIPATILAMVLIAGVPSAVGQVPPALAQAQTPVPAVEGAI